MSQKQPEPRIVVETLPNLAFRNYHVNKEVSKAYLETFYRPIRSTSEPHLKEVGPMARRIVETILAIPGVVEVGMHPYKIHVQVGNAFSWEDIDPQITKVLKRIIWIRKANKVSVTSKLPQEQRYTAKEESIPDIYL